jgi:hypothetical protein
MFESNPTPRSASEPAQVDHPSNRTRNGGRSSNVSSTVSSTFSRPDDTSVNSESESSSEIPAPRAVRKNMALDWPMEDGQVVKALPSPLRPKLHQAFSAGQKNKAKSPVSPVKKSPFKLIMNQELMTLEEPVVDDLPEQFSSNDEENKAPVTSRQSQELKTSEVALESDIAVKEETREVTWPSPKKEEDHRDDEPVVDDLPEQFSSNDEEENKAPVTANRRSRTTRALRLIRTKKFVPKTRNAELKVSLDAASVVMEEEKSNAGSSDASSRSSLSNHELSSIAHRALTLAKSKEKQGSITPPDSAKPSASNSSGSATPTRLSRASKLAARRGAGSTTPVSERTKTPETIDGTGGFGMPSQRPARPSKNDDASDCGSVNSEHSRSSLSKVRPGLVTAVRRTRTVTNVSHQEARKALLNAAQKKKEKTTAESHGEALARLGSRASRVVALKNSTKALVSKPETVQVVEEQAVVHPEANEKTTIVPVQVDRQSIPVQRREQHFDDACSVVSTASVDSKASRRSQHPAFAARSPLASRGGRKNSFSENDRENRSVSELEYESSKPRPSTGEAQQYLCLKLSTIASRDSLGDPPEVFENPESSSPGRSVISSRSMRSVSPPGRGPKFASEFNYLTKKPSKQSVDADPIKITVSKPKDRTKISISSELDPGQLSRDHATRVNINFDDIEPKQSWKSSSPTGAYLQKHTLS